MNWLKLKRECEDVSRTDRATADRIEDDHPMIAKQLRQAAEKDLMMVRNIESIINSGAVDHDILASLLAEDVR